MYAPKTPNAGGGARDVAAARARSVRPASVPAAASRLARRRSASRRAPRPRWFASPRIDRRRARRDFPSARTPGRPEDRTTNASTSAATRSRDAFARPTPPPPSKPSSKGLSKPSYKGLSKPSSKGLSFAFEGPGTRASRARTRVSSSPPALSGRTSPRIRASTLRGRFPTRAVSARRVRVRTTRTTRSVSATGTGPVQKGHARPPRPRVPSSSIVPIPRPPSIPTAIACSPPPPRAARLVRRPTSPSI